MTEQAPPNDSTDPKVNTTRRGDGFQVGPGENAAPTRRADEPLPDPQPRNPRRVLAG